MPDWLINSWDSLYGFFDGVSYGAVGVWSLTVCLLLLGLIGSVVPLLPGPVVIFAAGVVHTLLRPSAGMSWIGLIILCLLMILAYVVDFASGAIGARWFGASRWGIAGALVGGVAGLFFAPLGLIIGPLAGALLFELFFARKQFNPAVKSTWGTLLGTGLGLVARLAISLAMVATVLVDILWW